MPDSPGAKVDNAISASGPSIPRLERTLVALARDTDVAARLAADPVGIVHEFADPLDQELVGLLASCLAFGNVKTIRAKLRDALARIGRRPSLAADDAAKLRRSMKGFVHRVFLGEDVAKLMVGARRVQRAHGSLGARFAADWEATGDLRPALARFTSAIRDAGNLHATPKGRRGPAHILGNPAGSSASKRLLLYLRWMIRPTDGVDLGLWPLPPSILYCPVDTHIHKLARNLGMTKERTISWKAASDIASVLRRIDPDDPAKFDFALCHMGMLQRCPSRRDAARCEGCGVMPVCRHWARDVRSPRKKGLPTVVER